MGVGVCVCGGVIWHSQLSEMLIKPGLLQERGWNCLSELLIALASLNPFHPPWNVNCPFPFPSDQGGNDKANCGPVILSRQAPCLKAPLTSTAVLSYSACIGSSRHFVLSVLREECPHGYHCKLYAVFVCFFFLSFLTAAFYVFILPQFTDPFGGRVAQMTVLS